MGSDKFSQVHFLSDQKMVINTSSLCDFHTSAKISPIINFPKSLGILH